MLNYCIDLEEVFFASYLIEIQDDINFQDSTGMTALHYAVAIENKALFELLMDKKADLNIKD